MKLADLQPQFLQRTETDGLHYVDTLAEAHGVMFACPLCFQKNGGLEGTHSIICWFRGRVPDNASPGPGRWDPGGSSLADLTLSPSVFLNGPGCGWHGWVKSGDAS